MKLILSFTLCVLLPLTQVYGDDTSPDQTQNTGEAVSSDHEDLSRAKRALDYRRLARGIQMLRLGKRQLPLLRLGKREYPNDDLLLQNLLSSLDSQYYDEDYQSAEEPLHARYRRSADPSQETMPAGALLADSTQDSSSSAVKRSVNDLDDVGAEDSYLGDEDNAMEKRPMGMLRLGKRPVGMLRLGKRPVGMLRLGKRPVGMLRLGKRPVGMLRLGKRPVGMLRLGKRPVGMLRLGKRPVGMLRLGKRLTDLDSSDEEFEDSENVFDPDMNEEEDFSVENSPDGMLPQFQSDMPVPELEKRPVGMLRLGKRPVGMLRLGKRPVGMLRLGKRPVGMLRLGKRQLPLLRLGKRAAE